MALSPFILSSEIPTPPNLIQLSFREHKVRAAGASHSATA